MSGTALTPGATFCRPLEMTRHEFLDKNYRKERTTFADGTTVTVDWDTNTFAINPALEQETLTWQSCQKPARQQGLGCPP